MAIPLLTTKLYIPSPRVTPSALPLDMLKGRLRTSTVPRSRLVARLEEGLRQGRKLTLVSAPAGFGKTTLLGECAAHCKWPVAWVSLDEDDNDPAAFWTYVVSALLTVYPEIGSEALAGLGSPQPPPVKALLTGLVNELVATPRQVVLVLDDYHAISNRAIHDGLTFLLDHQPRQLHLVLSTRADPPLRVARLRGRGQLAELPADDLRFTPDEVTAFLNGVMGLDLLPEDVAALETRTEGWIVGLQLAALSMQDREDVHGFVTAFTGSHHYILEYLTEEVLQRQPKSVRQFLLQTSILERMCGPVRTRRGAGNPSCGRVDVDLRSHTRGKGVSCRENGISTQRGGSALAGVSCGGRARRYDDSARTGCC